MHEILTEIKLLKKKKKTSGPDVFNSIIINDIAHKIVTPLHYIYNLSLETGLIPSKLKVAKIVPIFKKDDSSLPSNYRPISILSIFSKIFEKIMSKRLLKFWEKMAAFINISLVSGKTILQPLP